MDQKAWLWRKKYSEKTIIATDKLDIPSKRNAEEAQMVPTHTEGGLERPAKNLNEKLASVLLNCHAKDDLVTKVVKMPQETITGCDKAEAECVKNESDEALRKGVAANENLCHSDAVLKESVKQLSIVQDEHEQKIHDAVMKTTLEFEKAQEKLEVKLAELSRRLASLASENTHLSNALLIKEKLVEDLHKRQSQTIAEFNALMTRLDSTEKENAFLKYEFHMLEKELEVKIDELEYNRRSADASRRQHLESVKKITKLEAECHRLRLLMQKRLPGPPALARMKNELGMQGRDQTEIRRRKLNPTRDMIVRDAANEHSPVLSSNKISILIEQVHDVEEENRTLKEIVTRKATELHSSRMMCARTVSRLSQVEAQLKELLKGQKYMEFARCGPLKNELSPRSGYDIGSDDGISSSSESWANALISELEHFRDGKLRDQWEHKPTGVSDMSLMDDFIEMEKLAIISVEKPGMSHLESTSKELVPVVQGHSGPSGMATDKPFDWLQEVLNAIFKQKRISKRSLDELLEDIRIALGYINLPTEPVTEAPTIPRLPRESDPLHVSVSKASPIINSSNGACYQPTQSNLSKSVCKIIELIEGINLTPLMSNDTQDNGSEWDQNSSLSANPAGYFVRVFQWRIAELSHVLQHFVHICHNLLNGKAELEKFAGELSFTLDWILNNCVAPKDASSARDKIKKHFGWNGSLSENEVESALNGPLVEPDVLHTPRKKPPCLHSVAFSCDQNVQFPMGSIRCDLQQEIKRLNDELKSMEHAKEDMEGGLKSATDKNEALIKQLEGSEQEIGSLRAELETLKDYKGMIEDQIENQKAVNEDLDTQLTVAKAKLNEILQKFSSLEVELEDKNNCCEELEATCLELQLQLESVAKNQTLNSRINEEEKQFQNGWEITAASVKLAECQETIVNLGKQLKALASPREAALFERVFPSVNAATTATNCKSLNKRFSLRDRMLAEDGTKAIVLRSPRNIINTEISEKPPVPLDAINALPAPDGLVCTPETCFGSKKRTGNTTTGTLSLVPSKKQGGVGLLRRLLMRRKKGSKKKPELLIKV